MHIYPPDHLKPFVRAYVVLEWQKMDANIYLPAWTNNFLFFKYGDVTDVELSNGKFLKGYDTMVTGCMTYALRFTRDVISANMISIDFQPMALYSFLKKDISFLTNNSIYADEIFPGAGRVMKKIKNTDNIPQKIEIINDFLTGIFQNVEYHENLYVQTFFDKIENAFTGRHGNFSLKEFVDSQDISERNFRRVFSKIVGMPPKLYYRIKKIEFILVQLHKGTEDKRHSLSENYVDQSHFIKDFTRFTGQGVKELQKYFSDDELNKIFNYL